MLNRNKQFIIVALMLSIVTGCGGSASEVPEELIPVTGSVKLDGKPTANITVVFNPGKNTGGTGGYGVTDSEGKYSILHRSNQPGIEAGEYIITFSKMGLPDGSPIPEGKDAADVGAVQLLPEKYTNPNRELNLMKAIVKTPGAQLEYELSSK